MPFQYTFRSDDITTWDADTRDLLENRDRELELYSTTIDNSFLNLNASNLTSGTVPSARMTGAYTGITGLGTLTGLTSSGQIDVSRGALGTVSGNSLTFFNPSATTANGDYLDTRLIRINNGSGWETAAWRIGRLVDLTRQGFIQFGDGASGQFVAFGVNNTVYGYVGTAGFFGVGTNLTSLNATNLSSGTVASARLSGSYTGITGVGTLTGLTIDGAGSRAITFGDWSASGNWTAIEGYNGYMLMGETSNRSIYLRTNTGSPIRMGANSSDTLLVNDGSITIATGVNSTVLSGNQFRLFITPSAYPTIGRMEIGELFGSPGIYANQSNISIAAISTTSFINPANGSTAAYITNVDGEYYGRSNIRIFTAGANFIAQSPTTSSGNAAQWLSAFGVFILVRNTSTRNDKENIQPLNNIVTPSMIDDIDISLWNRKNAEGFPEIGPMAEDMDNISPFLSIRGMDCDDEGNIVATDPTGINQNSWLSLLTLGIQDIRQRLQQLENP